MALELRNLERIGENLSRYLTQTWDRPVTATNLVETSVGARRGNILFDAVDGTQVHHLVVTIYPPAGTVIFGVTAETGALRLAEAAGAPVAHVYEICEDDSWFGEPFFISQRIEGETLPRNILRLVATDDALGAKIGRQLGTAFAAVHSVPATATPEAIWRSPFDETPSSAALAVLHEQMGELLQPTPSFALGLRWLERNQPSPPAHHVMVHSDVRNGNIIVGPDGLRAILDWEGCHTGDPHEDLGWVCVRTWRFGNDAFEVGGFSHRQPMVEAYEAAGGHYDPDSFAWWKVWATLKWGIGLSRQAVQHLNGTYRNIAMATSGRRAVELEHDLLRLLKAPLGR